MNLVLSCWWFHGSTAQLCPLIWVSEKRRTPPEHGTLTEPGNLETWKLNLETLLKMKVVREWGGLEDERRSCSTRKPHPASHCSGFSLTGGTKRDIFLNPVNGFTDLSVYLRTGKLKICHKRRKPKPLNSSNVYNKTIIFSSMQLQLVSCMDAVKSGGNVVLGMENI